MTAIRTAPVPAVPDSGPAVPCPVPDPVAAGQAQFTELEAEASCLGVHVTWQELPCGICGVYDWRHDRIVLHDGLTPVQARCTLCHELEHVRHGDFTCGGKGEARARRRTALRLVDPVEYAAAEQVYDGCAWRIACELGVTMQVVSDYRQLLYDSGVRIM